MAGTAAAATGPGITVMPVALPPWEITLAILGTLLAAILLNLVWRRVMRRFFTRLTVSTEDVERLRRLDTVGRVTRQTGTLVIMVLALLLSLHQVGISLAPLLGAAGVVGIAIGFGAQSLVKDFFSGFFLLIENQIRVGDVVEIAGKSGFVEELTLRRTKLRAWDGSVHYVSNGLITTVTNLSTEHAFAVIEVTVSYGADIDRVFALMCEVAERMRADPAHASRIMAPMEIAGVEAWTDLGVKVMGRVKTVPLQQWTVKREYLRRLQPVLSEAGIWIACSPGLMNDEADKRGAAPPWASAAPVRSTPPAARTTGAGMRASS